MENKVLVILKNIFNILARNDKLFLESNNLVEFSDSEIKTPIGDIFPFLLNQKSNLKDQIIDTNFLVKLVDALSKNNSIVRLNHIGFCYKVDSQEKEKERLIELIKQSKFHLYQEQSNDDGLWLFIGNTDDWENPLIELLPVEKTNDHWVDYWLPHIQIDIDTALTGKEIEDTVRSTFNNTIEPYQIKIDGVVYIVRNRIGVIGGVNINIDLATNSRNVQIARQNSLIKVI
ncbi:MAG: hypothetical protein HYW86_04685 [Candidatus Roizmanbacteria bacterium]|nr:MAG: hypothetical protein HYW86_04685 [Candidatus Roizmanbacteria bacterium]